MMDFLQFAESHGLNIDPRKFYPSNKIQRCPTRSHPKSRNGAYLWDGERGWVCDWSVSNDPIWYGSQEKREWTQEEKRRWQMRKDAQRKEEEAKHRRAIEAARKLIQSHRVGVHDYMVRKGFPDHQTMIGEDGSLLLPMRSWDGKLQGMQQIFYDQDKREWIKKMLYGSILKGSVNCIGDKNAKERWLCEGYATGLSIAAALRNVGIHACVVVCFSADNLLYVSRQIGGNQFIYADNDPPKLHPITGAQVGYKGERIAIETGKPYCMSDVVGNDANDDHQQFGIFAVTKKIMQTRLKTLKCA